MLKEHAFLLLACAFAVICFALFCHEKFFGKDKGTTEASATPKIGVVNVAKILQGSKPAVAARQHVDQAQKILQKAFDDVQAEWAGAPKEERDKVIGEAFAALNKQLDNEKAAAQKVVEDVMKEKIAAWKSGSGVQLVVNEQLLLDCDPRLDVTDEIMKRMDEAKPVFPDLPKVEVTKRSTAGEPKAAPANQDMAGKGVESGKEAPAAGNNVKESENPDEKKSTKKELSVPAKGR